jgi:hypothetical protein
MRTKRRATKNRRIDPEILHPTRIKACESSHSPKVVKVFFIHLARAKVVSKSLYTTSYPDTKIEQEVREYID